MPKAQITWTNRITHKINVYENCEVLNQFPELDRLFEHFIIEEITMRLKESYVSIQHIQKGGE